MVVPGWDQWSVLGGSCSALTLLSDQKGIWSSYTCATYPQKNLSSFGTVGEETQVELANPGHLENGVKMMIT